MKLHKNAQYHILIKFKFQLSRVKIKVKSKWLFEESVIRLLCFHLWSDFDITSFKCCV